MERFLTAISNRSIRGPTIPAERGARPDHLGQRKPQGSIPVRGEHRSAHGGADRWWRSAAVAAVDAGDLLQPRRHGGRRQRCPHPYGIDHRVAAGRCRSAVHPDRRHPRRLIDAGQEPPQRRDPLGVDREPHLLGQALPCQIPGEVPPSTRTRTFVPTFVPTWGGASRLLAGRLATTTETCAPGQCPRAVDPLGQREVLALGETAVGDTGR